MIMVAPPQFGCARVDPRDPVLESWVARLREQNPHFRHETGDPPFWLGLYVGERLLAAMGYLFYEDGTVLVQMAVCEPSKAGRVGLDAVIGICRNMWKSRRVLWWTQLDNRKMRKVYARVGATPIAAIYEVRA